MIVKTTAEKGNTRTESALDGHDTVTVDVSTNTEATDALTVEFTQDPSGGIKVSITDPDEPHAVFFGSPAALLKVLKRK